MQRFSFLTNSLLLLLLTVLFSWAMFFAMQNNNVDYIFHIRWAKEFRDGTGGLPANPLFEILAIGLSFFIPLTNNVTVATYYLSVIFHVLTGYLIYRLYLYPVLGEPQNRDDVFIAIFISLCLVIGSAIIFFSFFSRNLYFGYLQPVLYHNVKFAMLRVFALILFLRLAGSFSQKASVGGILITALLVILSTLTRPHLVMVFIPTFGLVAAWKLLKREFVDWKHLVFGLALAGGIILLIQIIVLPNAQNVDSGGGIAIMPFALGRGDFVGTIMLLPKYILSILFPIAVYWHYWPRVKQDFNLNLAWLGFFVGNLFSYLLVETQRIEHFNFNANSQIMAFLLMVLSMQFFLRQIRREGSFVLSKAELILFGIFALHVINGLLWLYTQTMFKGLLWW
jgi:hypothetical protein